MKRAHFTLTAAAVLACAAGTCLAQKDGSSKEPRDLSSARENRQAAVLDFYRGSKLIGMNVANPNDEVIASVQDLIVDRGSGRIEHALLKSGAVLGVGGKTIAIPYSRLGFDAAEKRFELDMTKEQIERSVEFVPENWTELQHTGWADRLDEWWYGEEELTDEDVQRTLKTGEREKVTGTIRSVERSRSGARGEHVSVTVQSDSGSTETIELGPSWYVMGDNAAPMRGDRIEAETAVVKDGKRVALSAKIEGDQLVLRDTDGIPRWRPTVDHRDQRDEVPSTKSNRAGRLVLLSKVIGADAMSADKTGGEVQDVVIERNSGQIALIGFDPNENLLGIADEIKVVPWPVVSIGPDQKARIDADSAMLKSCEKMPDDVAVFNTQARLDPIYSTFALRPVTFNERDRREARAAVGESWGKDGFYSKTFRDGADETVAGQVVEVRTTELKDGMPEARVVVIETENGKRSVILGPEWYIKRQTVALDDGARITVHGKRAKIGNDEYICAQLIETDGKSLTLWDRNNPMWDGR